MEKFKEKIRTRVLGMSLITIFSSLTYFILLFNQNNLPNRPNFVKGFQIGAFVGLELVLVYFIAKYLGSMKNDKSLKNLYIEENDERNIMIMQNTGAMGMSICNIGLAFATVIAGFFNQIAFFSLLAATVFTGLVKVLFKLYYHRKF